MKFFILFTLLSSSIGETLIERVYIKENIPNPTLKHTPPWDPDMDLDVPQIIRRHGYPSESHVVETEDGYLLNVHRVAGNKQGVKGGQPVLLQHGLMGSSADWVLNGENTLGLKEYSSNTQNSVEGSTPYSFARMYQQYPAPPPAVRTHASSQFKFYHDDQKTQHTFYLADNGYNVWLGNARGNIYSKAHTTFPVHSIQFWNFSWHEMGTKDLPAVINYISNQTNKAGEIIYIGHSMGTTMSYVLAATLPSVAQQLKLIVSLAPTVYMTNLKSPIRYLAPFSYDLSWIAKFIGIYDFAPTNKVLQLLSYECLREYGKEICDNLLFLIAGFNTNEFNMTMLPKVVAHDPAGASVKTLIHYAQEIKIGGGFQQFDYGPQINMVKYNSTTPPQYNISNIKAPFYLMYSLNDVMTSYIDVRRLSKQLPNLRGLHEVPDKTFGHVDFIFGMNASRFVYKPLLKFIKSYP